MVIKGSQKKHRSTTSTSQTPLLPAPPTEHDEDNRNSESFDATKFVSYAAQLTCESDSLRSIIGERGINLTGFGFEGWMKAHKWDKFVADKKYNGVNAWVREFYANANDCSGDNSWCRGHIVSYSEAAINDCYRIPCTREISDTFNEHLDRLTQSDVLAAIRINEDDDWVWTTGREPTPKLFK